MLRKARKIISYGLALSLMAASLPAYAGEIGTGVGIGAGVTVNDPTVPPIGSGTTVNDPTVPSIGSGATYNPYGDTYLYQTMYVNTGNRGVLNLRALPNKNAACIGQYAYGTSVLVLYLSDGWAYVLAGGQYGYMMSQYLSYYQPTPSYDPTPSESTVMYIKTGNSGRLHLRMAPSQSAASLGLYANGTQVTVLSRSGAWVYVSVGGQYGYMMRKFLSASYTPDPTPAPITPVETTIMFVSTGNSGRLHLRASPSQSSASLGLFSNGTQISMVSITGDWAYVITGDGRTGYMMRRFLSYTAPVTTSSIYSGGYATVAKAPNSYVNLRSFNSITSYNVIAQVPSGTVVLVLEAGDVWCQIQYGTMTGYMLTSFLR